MPVSDGRSRWLRHSAWLVIAAGAWSAFGFLLLPWLLTRELPPRLGAVLGVPVSVEQVRINPWLLTATIEGLQLDAGDGAPLILAARIHVNPKLFRSLWHRAVVLGELQLETPFVRLRREPDGRIELLELAATGNGSEAETAGEASLPGIVIDELILDAGIIAIEDRVPATPFQARIEPVSIRLSGISTLPDVEDGQQVMLSAAGGLSLGWSGTLQLNPFQSAGTISASGPWLGIATEYLSDQLAFLAEGEQLDLRVDHEIGLTADAGPLIQLTNGELTLSGLGLRRHEEGEPFARLPRLEARDLALNWPEQAVAIGDIFVADAWLLVTRESGGQLDLTSLLTMPVEPARGADQALAGPQDGADSPGQGWRWRLGGLEATGLSLDIEDRVPAATGRLALRDIGLAVGGISSALPEPFPVELALLLDSGGRIELGGQARVVPEVALDLRLAIDELGLAVVQPWLGEVLAARLDDGHLSAALALRVDPGKGPRLTGSTRIARLALGEPGSEATLLAWQKLSADGIRLSLDDSRLEISELLLDAPFVRLLIDTDGELNLAGLLRMTATDPAGPDHDAAPVEPLAVTVGELRIADGAADFTDLALPFPFRAEITALSGRIGVLDTASLAPAEVSLSGQVADYGEARLNGEISLANPVARTDLALSFRNVAIPDLSAYTVRFAGRRIADGRMDLDLRYRIDKAELRADHRLVLRRLALGEREHFPGAARLPLSLAIALLRGPDGTIDLELPVTGNIDDPRFELGSLILQTFTNLVTRITTAPFRLLGQLIGSTEEDLGVVLFRPGEAELAPPEREKLAQLAQALALRPALSVEVPAVSAGDADRRVLQKKQLEKRLAERTAAVDEQDQRSRLERERDALEALFAERTPAGSLEDLREQFERLLDPENPDGATALDFAAWITALRERLAAIEPVDDEALDELGRARRAAIMDWLQERRPDMAAQVLAGGVATRAPDGEGLIPLALEATAN